MEYRPEPIDTSAVELPEEIQELVERLARNTHALWAQGRLAEGWRYGPQRDDVKMEHPDLVPYDELPEAEKQYDRTTAAGVLKTIMALGYRIVSD